MSLSTSKMPRSKHLLPYVKEHASVRESKPPHDRGIPKAN
jgi:hypothetical protein